MSGANEGICPECGGEGVVDSGGQTPWGSWINVPCPLCCGKPITEQEAGWTMSDYEIKQDGYTAVKCDKPLPCPFCGADAKLVQLAHRTRIERIGRSRRFRDVKVCILASTTPLTADTFWFECPDCGCTTGKHKDNALDASKAWNHRASSTDF